MARPVTESVRLVGVSGNEQVGECVSDSGLEQVGERSSGVEQV